MRVLVIASLIAIAYTAEIKRKVENLDRSLDNSTSSGCETIHGAEPDENCLYHVDDMIFTQEELLAAYGDTTRNGINQASYRWPGNSEVKGQLPYAFDRNDIGVGSNEEKFITRVIKRFNMDLEGCLRIVPRTTELDYVKVGKNPAAGHSCSSQVGDVHWYKDQPLNLDGSVGGSGCYFDRTVVHEFIHAWGFTHEQNRPDRDSFVTIKEANLNVPISPNFDKKTNYLTYGVQYNGLSVMHYKTWDFSKQPGVLPVIISKRPELFTNDQMGTNDWMTLGDVSKLRQMYGCNTVCKNKYSNCQLLADLGYCEKPTHSLSLIQNGCKSSCNTCNGVCKDVQPTATCQAWAKLDWVSCYQNNAEKKWVGFMQENCRKTCDFCAADCKDNAIAVAKCPEYKNSGFCQSSSSNFKYMQINCRRTCNFCFGQNSRMDINDANLDLSFPELKMEPNDGDDTELPEFPIPDMKREQELPEFPIPDMKREQELQELPEFPIPDMKREQELKELHLDSKLSSV